MGGSDPEIALKLAPGTWHFPHLAVQYFITRIMRSWGRKRLKEIRGFTQEDPFRAPFIGLRIALAGQQLRHMCHKIWRNMFGVIVCIMG